MESDGLVQVWERWMIYQSDRGGGVLCQERVSKGSRGGYRSRTLYPKWSIDDMFPTRRMQ
jgi:hypothetical protein